MTGINAAYPGGAMNDRMTVERFHDVPMGFDLLGCPNCGDTDHLALIEDTRTATAILSAIRAVGTTSPDVSDLDPDGPKVIDGPTPVLRAVRCETCRWSLESPDCLHALKVVVL